MATRLTLRIHEKLARLTESESKIANIILNNQGIIETHTATELANLAGVSKATTARFFRTLGYADFEEVKLQARDERNRTPPYRYSVAASDEVVLGRAIGEHLELELQNLTRTFEEMRSDELIEIARLIADAPRVWFLGLGAEDGLARLGRSLFSRLRHDVMQLRGSGEDWAGELAMTGPRDVLIVLTLAPRPRVLRSILNYAKTTRMTIVTITDHGYFAKAGRFSAAVLACHIANYGPVPTHATMTSVLRLLAIAFAGQNPEAAAQRGEVIEAIDEELDLME